MLDHVAYIYGFNLGYAERLVRDVTPEQMTQQPSGLVNHPAWTLGHLVVSGGHLAQLLGLEANLPEGWDTIFTTGGTPSGESAGYPSKEELIDALKSQHARNTDALKQADPATFAAEHPNEQTRAYFPTVGDMVIFMMTSHEMDHIGQLAAWRRAMGLGSAT